MGHHQMIIDPGFGFGKTVEHNYQLLNNLERLTATGYPVLAGLSRKSMINRVLGTKPENALNGTTVLNTIALLKGASILRVHDVKEAVEAVRLCKNCDCRLPTLDCRLKFSTFQMLAILLTGFLKIRLLDVIDILLVAFILYELYNLLKGSVSINMFFAIVAHVLHLAGDRCVADGTVTGDPGRVFQCRDHCSVYHLPAGDQAISTHTRQAGFHPADAEKFPFLAYNGCQSYIVDIDKIVHACQKMSNNKQAH